MLDNLFMILIYTSIIIYFFNEKLYILENKNEITDNLGLLVLFFCFINRGPKGWEILLIIIALLLLVKKRQAITNKIININILSLIFLILYGSLISYFVKYPSNSLNFIINILKFSIGFYIATSITKNKKGFHRIIKILIMIFWINIFISLIEILTQHHMLNSGVNLYNWNKSYPTTYFFNINNFGSYLVLMVPFLYYYYTKIKKNFILLGTLYTYIMFILIFISADLLILANAIQYIFIFWITISDKLDRIIKLILALSIIIILLSAILLISLDKLSIIFKTYDLASISMTSRYILWIKGIELLRTNLLGIGFDSFQYYSVNEYSSLFNIFKSYFQSPFSIATNSFPIHNFFLDVIVSCGIGSIPFLYGYSKAFIKLKSYKIKYSRVMFISMIIFFIVAISPASIVISPVFWTWYIGILSYLKYENIRINDIRREVIE